MPKLWLEIARPSRANRFKAAIKTKPSAGLVAPRGLTGTGGDDLALRSLVIINSAGRPAVFFESKKWEPRNTTEGHDCPPSALDAATSWS